MEELGSFIFDFIGNIIGGRVRYLFYKLSGKEYKGKRCLVEDKSIWNALIGWIIVLPFAIALIAYIFLTF